MSNLHTSIKYKWGNVCLSLFNIKDNYITIVFNISTRFFYCCSKAVHKVSSIVSGNWTIVLSLFHKHKEEQCYCHCSKNSSTSCLSLFHSNAQGFWTCLTKRMNLLVQVFQNSNKFCVIINSDNCTTFIFLYHCFTINKCTSCPSLLHTSEYMFLSLLQRIGQVCFIISSKTWTSVWSLF